MQIKQITVISKLTLMLSYLALNIQEAIKFSPEVIREAEQHSGFKLAFNSEEKEEFVAEWTSLWEQIGMIVTQACKQAKFEFTVTTRRWVPNYPQFDVKFCLKHYGGLSSSTKEEICLIEELIRQLHPLHSHSSFQAYIVFLKIVELQEYIEQPQPAFQERGVTP